QFPSVFIVHEEARGGGPAVGRNPQAIVGAVDRDTGAREVGALDVRRRAVRPRETKIHGARRLVPPGVEEIEDLCRFRQQDVVGRTKGDRERSTAKRRWVSSHSASGMLGSNALTITRWRGSACF